MPLTIPQYITVKTAAGATAAYLSPEADGLKDCQVARELNGPCTLTLSLPLTDEEKIHHIGWQTEIEQALSPFSTALNSGRYMAQGFAATGELAGARKIKAQVKAVNKAGEPPDTHWHVYNDNNGVPGSSISSNGYGVVAGADWPSGWVSVEITLDEPLQEGLQYWLVLAGQGMYNASNLVRMGRSGSNPYAGGYSCTSENGLSWTKNTTYDLTFKLEAPVYTAVKKSPWQYLTDSYRIYAPDITGQMREFIILNPDAITKVRNGRKVWGKISAHESWVRLGKDFVDPAGISNDPQTPSPPALAVVILSGGSDLSGGLYTIGSAGHALYAILQGTGWSVGTVDVTGIYDLETEKISILASVQKVQEIWGGYLLWDSVNKIVHLRDETTWAPYTGYQIRYAKNEKSITRNDDYDIITKLYPFGEDDLDIGSVNGGQIYLTNNSYTAEVLTGIWPNQDIQDPQELKDKATAYLAKVCKPRHNYRAKHVDLRLKSGYQHEDYDLGHLVDLIDEELSFDDQARIISYRFDVFQPWNPELEVGDPIEKIDSMIENSQAMAQYLNSIKTSRGQITAYKLVDDSIIKQKIASAAVDATKLDTNTVILLGDAWADNNPAGGSVSWNQHKLYYAGVEYVINAGNTAQKYIYWDGVSNTYSASATEPELTDGQFYIAVNNGGLHDLVWNAPTARKFIGSLFIADAAIKTAHIDDLAVTDAKIASLTANKITTGQLLAYLVEVVGRNGYFRINGDEFLVYDKSGALMGRFGHYETLAEQIATFARASTAYKQDGSSVASGIPRYEYARIPAPVWADTFDSDSLAEYISGGDAPATWAIADGVLTGTGGTQATLIKNNLLLRDMEIEVNSDQAHDGGIIARWQGNNDYYLLALRDDSGEANNLQLYKCIGGSLTSLATADVTWVRGTSKLIKFTLHGSRLEAWFEGVKVISVTDTALSGGSVGVRNNSATAFRVLDFNVYYASQGVMIEEGTTNLLTANQASVETDTTGFASQNGASISRVTAEYWHGNASLKVVTPGSVQYEGSRTSVISITGGQTYNLSVYLKGSGTVRLRAANQVGATRATSDAANLNSSWQRLTVAVTMDSADTGLILYVNTHTITQAITFYADGFQLEQKPYNTSWQLPGSARTPESLTVPTSVLSPAEGAIDFVFVVDSKSQASSGPAFHMVFSVTDSNEANQIRFAKFQSTNRWIAKMTNSAAAAWEASTSLADGVHFGTITWKASGTLAALYIDGAEIGSTSAAKIPSTFAASVGGVIQLGSWKSGSNYLNSLIGNYRISNQYRTLAEHQADYNSGLPLTVDDATTYLMSCDGHLQPTEREFGLYSASGKIVSNIISGSTVFGSTVKSCENINDNTYVALVPPNQFVVYYYGNKVLETMANSAQGHLKFFEEGVQRGRIYAGGQSNPTLYVIAEDGSGAKKRLYLQGAAVDIFGTDITIDPSGTCYVLGNFTVSGGTKNCLEFTKNFGRRVLSARESPEVKYIDEGKAALINGECTIKLDPIFLECIEPNTDATPWLIQLTPYADAGLYVKEIGADYFTVKERGAGISNSVFTWFLSATRINFANIRLQEVF